MTGARFESYDQAAYEMFCADLVKAGFSPKPGADRKIWFGPLPAFLAPLTDRRHLQVWFVEGWPLRYARPVVEGLHLPHSAGGTICLWGEDDPAQVAGRSFARWLARLRAWAEKVTADDFGPEDQAVDSFMAYFPHNQFIAELPLEDLVVPGTNGYRRELDGHVRGQVVQISASDVTSSTDQASLRGILFLRGELSEPPSNLSHFRSLLTRKQTIALDSGLAQREPTALLERSDGLDFAVLCWPRPDGIHDAVVVGFAGATDAVVGTAFRVAPNDLVSLVRRSGPDFDALQDEGVLVIGAGSVGGHVAVQLAAAGVGFLRVVDDGVLQSVNVIRHVCGSEDVGKFKAAAVAALIERDAPRCDVAAHSVALPLVPSQIREDIKSYSMVVDCTGSFAVAGALATECASLNVPLISAALFHQGALLRVRRQAQGDTPIAERHLDPEKFVPLPAEDAVQNAAEGFLELGCGAPINNAPPVSVAAAAVTASSAAVDCLAGRRTLPSEQLIVLRPLAHEPFKMVGPVLLDEQR